MLANFRPAVVLLLLFTALTGLAYPLGITAVAAITLADKASGSMIRNGDRVIGSRLIGQQFQSDRYFWPRPSATAEVAYNAGASSGTNLGPTSAKLRDMVAAAVRHIGEAGIDGPIPADAVTASGSGLDPDISPAFAQRQIARVAKARGLDPDQVASLVDDQTALPWLGLFGEPRVNVLALNIALDSLEPQG
ncbi:potassium-transporting ATPase subunit KdpC [Rhizobium alvei]|uniref:Potassium-transporting ATPase KdpC subunit n=1 Tax=Rhizobium alvei TaxID=1132659 RepID=A0ABT8YQT0_9HYPH|nr:potassium-transporting ATPase subunit KdpC [Rhizobium alvei]MDO6966079.1 potassium-transporting ATPase subunit KdpC [Rhizobium alvei]